MPASKPISLPVSGNGSALISTVNIANHLPHSFLIASVFILPMIWRESLSLTIPIFESVSLLLITDQIRMMVGVKKGRQKAVKQYAQATVFNDKTKAYTLRSWLLTKVPPEDCK